MSDNNDRRAYEDQESDCLGIRITEARVGPNPGFYVSLLKRTTKKSCKYFSVRYNGLGPTKSILLSLLQPPSSTTSKEPNFNVWALRDYPSLWGTLHHRIRKVQEDGIDICSVLMRVPWPCHIMIDVIWVGSLCESGSKSQAGARQGRGSLFL